MKKFEHLLKKKKKKKILLKKINQLTFKMFDKNL